MTTRNHRASRRRPTSSTRLRVGGRIGKYKILRRIGEGGFATVYRARDTIEGMDVALKVPELALATGNAFDELKREVRLTATLEHPNILPVKNAEVIDGRFLIASPLGVETLEDRMTRRMSARRALGYALQAIDAVAHAHERRVIHCDIKPANMILFPDDRLRLGDFGIARVAMAHTTFASIAGTLGYMAPEQAMGRPSARSDVFSLGLVLYRLFSGQLPEWPFDWPPAGHDRARQTLHPDTLAIVKRCIEVDQRKRYASAVELKRAFQRVRTRALRPRASRQPARGKPAGKRDWRSLRAREFVRTHGSALETRAECTKCHGPISESMRFCPWCSQRIRRYTGPARFTSKCGRCGRSAKRDWRFCPHCYGGAIQEPSTRRYTDRRYSASCYRCKEELMPFMAYCPHCRAKPRQRWNLEGNPHRCARCGWGVLRDYWQHCAWCGRGIDAR